MRILFGVSEAIRKLQGEMKSFPAQAWRNAIAACLTYSVIHALSDNIFLKIPSKASGYGFYWHFSATTIMKILINHNRYIHQGGEDVVDNEILSHCEGLSLSVQLFSIQSGNTQTFLQTNALLAPLG